jgi:arsenate reductase (thioredoxin)
MAESIAQRDAADLMECASAGLRPLGVIQELTLETLEANGYPTEGLYSKPILEDAWDAADLVINMSGHAKHRAFPNVDWDKVEDWDVQDPYGADPEFYQEIFEDIRTKIESLVARLRTPQA